MELARGKAKDKKENLDMSKLYQYTYNNNLIDGAAYIYKEGTTWAYDIMNSNGVFSRNGFKTKKDAKTTVERMIGCRLKSLPIKK